MFLNGGLSVLTYTDFSVCGVKKHPGCEDSFLQARRGACRFAVYAGLWHQVATLSDI